MDVEQRSGHTLICILKAETLTITLARDGSRMGNHEVAQQAKRGKPEYDVRLDLLQQESQLLRPRRGMVRNTLSTLGNA